MRRMGRFIRQKKQKADLMNWLLNTREEVYDPEIHAWMPLPKHYQPQKMFSQEPDLMEHSILRDDDPEMYTGKYVYEQMSIEEFLGEVDR